jgi:hypothetical protein
MSTTASDDFPSAAPDTSAAAPDAEWQQLIHAIQTAEGTRRGAPCERVSGSWAPDQHGIKRMTVGVILAAHDRDMDRVDDLLAGRNKAELMKILKILAIGAAKFTERDQMESMAYRDAAA